MKNKGIQTMDLRGIQTMDFRGITSMDLSFGVMGMG
jgi:hypothetical protein